MHIATLMEFTNHLIPNVEKLVKSIKDKSLEWARVIKIGRTHLQDAVPLTVGQEWSGYAIQLEDAIEVIKMSKKGLYNPHDTLVYLIVYKPRRVYYLTNVLSQLFTNYLCDDTTVPRSSIHFYQNYLLPGT